MKKLESTLPNMVLVLTVVSVVAAALLAYVNNITAGPIQEIKAKTLADGIKAVLNADDLTVEAPVTLDNGSVVYKTDKGVAVQSSDPNGFGGTLTVLVGFAADGSIQGYQVLEASETPGLGAKATFWFQEGQKGNIIGKNPSTELMVKQDGGEVDAITASTITSRAFLRAVNAAYKAYAGGVSVDTESGATEQVAKEEAVTETEESNN